LSEYYLRRGRNNKGDAKYPGTRCKKCVCAYMAEKWRNDDGTLRKRNKKYSRKSNLAKRGVTPAMYAEMYLKQGGKCLICQKSHGKRRNLCVDHCHDTGRVRGLLCTACNVGIGNLKDDPDLVLRAHHYLKGTL
jgi:hypothetical protein